jgi:prepilin-type N-terminal cleavage/methylation domain-containing protein
MRKKTVLLKNHGFTLVEMIVVLVMIGIIATAAGIGVLSVVEGFVYAKGNVAIVQKGQMAMAKLVRELNHLNSVHAAGPTSISFSSYRDGVLNDHTIALAGNMITYDGDILTDQVENLTLGYYDTYDGSQETTWAAARRVIEITIALTEAGGEVLEFTERVRPRNL